MKIAVTGVTGLVGAEIGRFLSREHDVIGVGRSPVPWLEKNAEADLANAQGIYSAITRANPDVVIHCAAMSNVDECEKRQDDAFRVNALGTRNVALACQRFDAAMLYISTDYVFSGTGAPKTGWTEFDRTEPVSAYGRTKLAGEWYVRHLLNKFWIVRTSWLFGPARETFIDSVAKALIAGTEIKAAADMASAPTFSGDLASAVAKLVERSAYGTYHITNSGFATRVEMASAIAKMLGAKMHMIREVSVNDLGLPAKRPAFSGLDNSVWRCDGNHPLRRWETALAEYLKLREYA